MSPNSPTISHTDDRELHEGFTSPSPPPSSPEDETTLPTRGHPAQHGPGSVHQTKLAGALFHAHSVVAGAANVHERDSRTPLRGILAPGARIRCGVSLPRGSECSISPQAHPLHVRSDSWSWRLRRARLVLRPTRATRRFSGWPTLLEAMHGRHGLVCLCACGWLALARAAPPGVHTRPSPSSQDLLSHNVSPPRVVGRTEESFWRICSDTRSLMYSYSVL